MVRIQRPRKSWLEDEERRTALFRMWQNKFADQNAKLGTLMNVNDSITPADDSWVDYCDALAKDAWLEAQQKGSLKRKSGSRINLQDKSKSVAVPEEPSTLNAG